MTVIEKILAGHSKHAVVNPGEIIDVEIDIRAARDFGGANVVKNITGHGLGIDDPSRTFFTFDCNPTGSDQKYAANQHACRLFARDNGIPVFDIDAGIGTHLMIEKGLVGPGMTAVSTDSHANILGAIGAFGQGMGDMDIALAMAKGKLWFKVPPTVKINLNGVLNHGVSAKDIVLNLLHLFGANDLLGYAIEMGGEVSRRFSLEQRITISSMATEMGAIIILFDPLPEMMEHYRNRSGKPVRHYTADPDAMYARIIDLDCSTFVPRVSKPGNPEDTATIAEVAHKKIDSAFIGSCTNGRMEDMREAAAILKNRKVAPGVVLKIVPATAEVWDACLNEGLLEIFREAGAMVSNPGCAGCAAGQVGQNGPGEVTISTGNRNFAGKQGKGEVYLASPAVVAASAVAGFITNAGEIPPEAAIFQPTGKYVAKKSTPNGPVNKQTRPEFAEGRAWVIPVDNIDTDMIFHNRYLTITDPAQMGQYAFDNLKGHEDFSKKARPGDIIVTGKNFGAGSSRQQAVDCFLTLKTGCIIAGSFGAIYERNAINAALPIIAAEGMDMLEVENGDMLRVDFKSGLITNLTKGKSVNGKGFAEVQMEIYQNGGVF